MSDLVKDVQKQTISSGYVFLYELEYSSGSFARFYAGVDEDLTDIEFRDSSGNIVTYTAIPMQAEGFDISSDGSYSRPTLSVGNLGTVFTDAIGGLSHQDLIGKRLTRRTTLEKYLVGGTGDSGSGNPPVEFPKIVYIIDRVQSKTVASITFELAAPFDLAGITLPRRVIVGGACPFKYKGAAASVSEANKIGGCNWDETIIATDTSNVFMNKFDEYIVSSSISFTVFTAGATNATKGNYYRTSESKTQLNKNGQSAQTLVAYWQALAATTTTPSDTAPALWRRVRVFQNYSASTTYYGYTDSRCNSYVLKSGKLWQVAKFTQVGGSHDTVQEGVYWTEGDICGKKIKSCSLRFHAKEHSSITAGIAVETNSNIALPFGGFPGVRQRR